MKPAYKEIVECLRVAGGETEKSIAAMEELRLYAAIISNMAEGVYLLSVDDCIIRYANPRFEQMFGYDPGEMDGKHVSILNASVDVSPKKRAKQILAVLEESGRWQGEVENIKKDGKRFWCYANVSSFEHARYGKVWISVHTDITARKVAEEQREKLLAGQTNALTALRRSEERLDRSLVAAHAVAWEGDLATGALSESGAVEELFVRPAGFRHRSEAEFFEDVHPDDRATMRTQLELAMQSRSGKYAVEFRVLRPDGGIRWMAATGNVERDSAGRPVRLHGLARDITEHKRGEESHVRLVTAVEQVAEAIVITDANAIILYANPAFEKITGYGCKEAIGENPRMLKSGKQDTEFYQRMWEMLGRGEVWKGHFINKKKDGTLYEEDAAISPVRDAAGKIVNYVAVKRDVTQELLLQSQLHQAQKMELVGRLAGGMAHDFNNLLMGIMGYAEQCRDSLSARHPGRGCLDEVQKEARRSADLIRQLMGFARKQTISPRVLELNTAVENILKLVRRMVGEDIAVTWLPGQAVWPVEFDPSQLDQILMNLCVNARDAIRGTGKVTIETANVTLDNAYCLDHKGCVSGEYVMLAIGDDGCGMTKDVLDHLFEPFFTTKDVGHGTGMGLASVYGIVKQNSGYIDVYSEPGMGTKVKVYLPRFAGKEEKTSGGSTAKAPRGHGEIVLVVEDQESVRTTCRVFLKKLGYEVLEAETPAAALDLAARHPGGIHLLLTDVVMPGMNGQELAKRLAVVKPGFKCLYMSGYTADVIGRNGMLERDVSFIGKPFSGDELARKVREALKAPDHVIALRRQSKGEKK